jgi:hypothetical protein
MIRTRRPAEQRARAQARANALAQANALNGSPDGPEEEDERTENGRSDNEDEDDSGSETETEARVTVARKKGESSEERKARKAGVKADRQVCISPSTRVRLQTLALTWEVPSVVWQWPCIARHRTHTVHARRASFLVPYP